MSTKMDGHLQRSSHAWHARRRHPSCIPNQPGQLRIVLQRALAGRTGIPPGRQGHLSHQGHRNCQESSRLDPAKGMLSPPAASPRRTNRIQGEDSSEKGPTRLTRFEFLLDDDPGNYPTITSQISTSEAITPPSRADSTVYQLCNIEFISPVPFESLRTERSPEGRIVRYMSYVLLVTCEGASLNIDVEAFGQKLSTMSLSITFNRAAPASTLGRRESVREREAQPPLRRDRDPPPRRGSDSPPRAIRRPSTSGASARQPAPPDEGNPARRPSRSHGPSSTPESRPREPVAPRTPGVGLLDMLRRVSTRPNSSGTRRRGSGGREANSGNGGRRRDSLSRSLVGLASSTLYDLPETNVPPPEAEERTRPQHGRRNPEPQDPWRRRRGQESRRASLSPPSERGDD